ncbi:unnamed protein product [Cunninghamella blakesleeana]
MTKEEIEEALARVSGKAPSTSASTAVSNSQYAQPNGVVLHSTPPPVPTRPKYDWRDIFIAAVVAGGVSYGVWVLAKRVFGPWFKVPTKKELEEDKEKLDEQFQAVEDSLKEIKSQTNEALNSVSEQSKRVEQSLGSLETVLNDLKDSDQQREEEFKGIKNEVDSLKELVPKMLDRNKDAQNAVLNDLQNEIKSLKSLLLSRRSTGSSLIDQISNSNNNNSGNNSAATTAPSTNGNITTGTNSNSSTSTVPNTEGLSPRLSAAFNTSTRPGIPAWQLSSNKATESKNETTSK